MHSVLTRCLRRILVVAVLFALTVSAHAAARRPAPEGFQHPVLRVSKMTRPPTLDGVIKPGEWDDAAAVSGFAAGGPSSSQSLVPEIQQVVWHIGFDDKYLYLAMRSPQKRGTFPVARCKEDDNMAVLFEDHVEIQICPWDRAKATRPGVGFYKMMVNPKAAMIDQYLFNGTVGTEELWSTGGAVKCSVTPDHWDLEMAIEITRLKVKKLDGRDLTIQLVRTDSCTGIYFAGWTNASWLEWSRFAQVDFDSTAPVFRFVRVGEVMSGTLDTLVEIEGTTPRATAVDVEVTVENAEGKVVYKEKQTATVKRGETKSLNWKKTGIPLSPVTIGQTARNHYDIKATYRDGRRTVVLYHNRSPFVILDDAFRKKFLNPWLAGRPQTGEWTYRVAYLPYSNKAEVAVDLDFFGMPKDVLAAKAFSVEILKRGTKNVIARGGSKIADLKASTLLSVPELADGTYEARFRLTDASERQVISEKTATFDRKHFPFEHNKIGISDEVIPPFTPMSVRGNDLYVWGRAYAVGKGGLLDQITAGVPTGQVGQPMPLLSAPMRLEVRAGGKLLPNTNATVKVVSAKGDRVDVEGAQQAGPVAVNVKAFEEYDGWYQVQLDLAPKQKTRVDSVDLVIDLRHTPNECPVDTLYVQRLGDGRYGNVFEALSERPGVQFKSTDLLRCRRGKDWKSFVPITYVGNGDRGLWLFAWSSIGWELSDTDPAVQVERLKDKTVRLRVRLIAGPVDLVAPRRLRFALQAAPVKPNDSRYRTRVDEGAFAHDTRGYRLYGDSVDSYALHREEDFTALRKFLMYGPRYQENGKKYGWWIGHYTHKIQEGARIIMYGSTWMTGAGAPEFRSFGGEWLHTSNWRARPDTTYTGNWNYHGTVQWLTPEQLMPTGCNFTQSHIDFFVWYHKLLVEKCGINGTWWDNSSIGTVREYDPEIGAMDSKWNLIYRRQLCKRLSVMGWSLNRPPVWAQNMHVDLSWNQVFWMVENDWYADATDLTALQQWTLGEFRAMGRTKSTVLVTKPWLSGFHGSTSALDRKIQRSLVAMLLSHDIVPPTAWNSPSVVAEVKRRLEFLLALSSTRGCLFAGYWRTGRAIEPAGKNVCASIYQNPTRKAAVIIFMNAEKRDQYLAGTTFDAQAVLGARQLPNVKKIYDLETGEPVKTVFESGRFKITEPFLVPWHEFRLLAIEGE